MNDSQLLLEVKGLKKYFPIKTTFLRRKIGDVRAVDGVDLHIRRGETLGLVGESGCGKTTLGRSVLRAIEPTSGSIVYQLNGARIDVMGLSPEQLRDARQHMQMIFQDPYSSLDPRMTVMDIIGEPLGAFGAYGGQRKVERVRELVELVGLDGRYMRRYPHAFSGGQRQRIGVARALATNPEFVVCDEPVSALDVSVRSQILNLLADLQEQLTLSYLFVSHDLSVVRHVSHRVAVMYVGKIVETAVTDELYRHPQHPYTEALLSAIPVPNPRSKAAHIVLAGELPNPARPPAGCRFHPRCRYAIDVCRELEPALAEGLPQHLVACHRAAELDLRGTPR